MNVNPSIVTLFAEISKRAFDKMASLLPRDAAVEPEIPFFAPLIVNDFVTL